MPPSTTSRIRRSSSERGRLGGRSTGRSRTQDMNPRTLDHVALWVAGRDRMAEIATEQLGMHVIERTDRFTLVGADARRGKLTLLRGGGAARARRAPPGRPAGLVPGGARAGRLISARASRSCSSRGRPTSSSTSTTSARLSGSGRRRGGVARRSGSRGRGETRVEVGGAFLELVHGRRGADGAAAAEPPRACSSTPSRSTSRSAEERGIEIDDVVDAPNTLRGLLSGARIASGSSTSSTSRRSRSPEPAPDRRRRHGRPRARPPAPASSVPSRSSTRRATVPAARCSSRRGVVWRHRTLDEFREECPGGDPALQRRDRRASSTRRSTGSSRSARRSSRARPGTRARSARASTRAA